jgi:hypothetical protein
VPHNYPHEQRTANKGTASMPLNSNVNKLRTTFTNFNDAIKKEKWDEAAKQYNRSGVNATRNTYVKGLFNDTHTASQKASAAKPKVTTP